MGKNVLYEIFANEKPYVYVIFTSLLLMLHGIPIKHSDRLLVYINVIIYIAMTTCIYFFITRNERKNIEKKIFTQFLDTLYDIDPFNYDALVLKIEQGFYKRDVNTSNNELNTMSTVILGCVFVCILTIYAYIFNKNIDKNKIKNGTFILMLLATTEVFISMFFLRDIPIPHLSNVIDGYLQPFSSCKYDNIFNLSNDRHLQYYKCSKSEYPPRDQFWQFMKSNNIKEGETCYVTTRDVKTGKIIDDHKFICDTKTNKIVRTTT